jgi:hypothetical protein
VRDDGAVETAAAEFRQQAVETRGMFGRRHAARRPGRGGARGPSA